MLSKEFNGVGADLFKVAAELEVEGIVSKRRDKPHRSGRRFEWLKTKCVQSGEFVIIAYQPTLGALRGAREHQGRDLLRRAAVVCRRGRHRVQRGGR